MRPNIIVFQETCYDLNCKRKNTKEIQCLLSNGTINSLSCECHSRNNTCISFHCMGFNFSSIKKRWNVFHMKWVGWRGKYPGITHRELWAAQSLPAVVGTQLWPRTTAIPRVSSSDHRGTHFMKTWSSRAVCDPNSSISRVKIDGPFVLQFLLIVLVSILLGKGSIFLSVE